MNDVHDIQYTSLLKRLWHEIIYFRIVGFFVRWLTQCYWFWKQDAKWTISMFENVAVWLYPSNSVNEHQMHLIYSYVTLVQISLPEYFLFKEMRNVLSTARWKVCSRMHSRLWFSNERAVALNRFSPGFHLFEIFCLLSVSFSDFITLKIDKIENI